MADTLVDPFAGADAGRFGRRQRRARGARIPVTVVTGFLGAGKTTLIRALLARPEGAGTAVVVNEYGEVGIDDALLRSSSDTTVLLGNGCLCCSMRSDLQETLRTLFADRAQGRVPGFTRVIIETSGLADPGPVLQTFATDRALAGEFHLQGMVAVVDAPSGAENLARAPEARHQVAVADRVVLTKTDLVDEPARTALVERLRALSSAPIEIARDGIIEPGFVLDEPLDPPLPGSVTSAQAGVHGPLDSRLRGIDGKRAGNEQQSAHDHGPHEHVHSHGIASFTLFFDAPLPWPVVDQAMAVLIALRGPDLLRVKGLVAVEGCRGPVVVHAVQHVAHRPIELEDWPTPDRRSRLVFITRDLSAGPVRQLFATVAAIAPSG
ncbi:MAG: GTP-binding protein [Alphaproteobacteria bacterium]|nr:GTP-binding protein [Alphaproteobacteria bacterium]